MKEIKNKGKNFLLSRTFWVNIIVLILALLDLLKDYISYRTAILIMGILNIFLRFITDKPVRFK